MEALQLWLTENLETLIGLAITFVSVNGATLIAIVFAWIKDRIKLGKQNATLNELKIKLEKEYGDKVDALKQDLIEVIQSMSDDVKDAIKLKEEQRKAEKEKLKLELEESLNKIEVK